MQSFWDISYVETVSFYVVAVISILLSLAVFELVTSYSNWEQIRKGNLSVAMATGGKVFGIANIFRFSIAHNDTVWQALQWSGLGLLLLLAAYFIFEFLTPHFKVDQQLEKDNRAVGLIAMCLSIGTSFVIGASIMV